MGKISTRSTKRLREPTIQYAEECDKKSAEGISPRKVPFRLILATMAGAQVKFGLHGMDESDKTHLRECAILAMQDHAIRFEEYRAGLRFVKLLKVFQKLVAGVRYTITFVGACDKLGETVYEAVVFDSKVRRKVHHVWIPTPKGECCTGILCIPLISITMDIASSSNVSPCEIPAIGGDEDKLVFDDTTKEATLLDCAILAMQDHAIQNNYHEGLRFIKLLKFETSFVDGYFYSITFRGASDEYGEATYEANVYEDDIERKVGCVRTISPPKRWNTGILCIPKIACKTE